MQPGAGYGTKSFARGVDVGGRSSIDFFCVSNSYARRTRVDR